KLWVADDAGEDRYDLLCRLQPRVDEIDERPADRHPAAVPRETIDDLSEAGALLHDGKHKVELVGEVVVDGSLRHAGGPGDLLRRAPGQSLPDEQCACGIDKARAHGPG